MMEILPKFGQNITKILCVDSRGGIPISILRCVKFVHWWFAFSLFNWFLHENEDRNQIWREILEFLKNRSHMRWGWGGGGRGGGVSPPHVFAKLNITITIIHFLKISIYFFFFSLSRFLISLTPHFKFASDTTENKITILRYI